MKITVQATRQKLTPEELKEMIPREKLESLVGKGELRAYVLAHEGTSQPRVIGEGTKTFKWTRRVIEQLSRIVKSGIKFFVRHNEDNSTEGRPHVATVVGSGVKEIDGKLSNVVVGHFPNAEEASQFDVVSMEGDITVSPEDESLVDAVNNLTGIAVGSSSEESPAFPGARYMASVQCFAALTEEKPETLEKEKDMPVTFEEVKKFVHEHNVWPNQLFTEDQVKEDRVFGKAYERISTLEADKERLDKAVEELKKNSSEAIKKNRETEAKGQLEKHLDGRTDLQKKFIREKFDPGKLEEVNEATIKAQVESLSKEFAEYAKLFGNEAAGGDSGSPGDGRKDETADDPVNAALKDIEEG